ncbi:hypothetical protein [Massilia horti]|uniref:Glycine zipper domain-containing protein n=1 Tax=Massilia horti TaxID=2562153 RepID=A0A4Y9T8I9_9BURK|nr:hypothetical protein [Massilia horti]TFW36034.1 hypothetical protein E4O92_00575 [Massilia horti]
MSTIIAGHFQLQDEVEQARQALAEHGFDPDRISGFFLSQPGQHDMTPIGGDYIESPGAEDAPVGVVEGVTGGAAIGVAVGAVTAPVTGPLGPLVGGLVGAHLGSLFSFSKMHEAGQQGEDEPCAAGMVLAVALDDPAREGRAVEVLKSLGAERIARTTGNIVGGDWTDFDPTVPVHLIS